MTSVVPCVAPGVQSVDIEDDVLLFDGAVLHRLHDTSATVFRLIDGAASTDDITASLAEQYDAPGDTISRDLRMLLGELSESGLVTLTTSAGARYCVPRHVGYVRDGQAVVLADLRTGDRSALAQLGALVWDEVRQGATAQDVLSGLGITDEEKAEQVRALLDELSRAGLLERRV